MTAGDGTDVTEIAQVPGERLDGWWSIECRGAISEPDLRIVRECLKDVPYDARDVLIVNGITCRWHARPDSLDAAWAQAEAALPEGWWIKQMVSAANVEPPPADGADWWVDAYGPAGAVISGGGLTPAAALHALAARLERLW